MKKVMVVIPALGSGGGERLAVSLIAKMDPEKIQTKLIVLYPFEDTENARFVQEKKIDTVYLGKHRGIDFSIIRKLKKEIDCFHHRRELRNIILFIMSQKKKLLDFDVLLIELHSDLEIVFQLQ